ncbi:GDP-mannose 4,6-dehydratase [Ferruginibacter sp.]
MNTILVTGCAGFIGSHVCSLLLAKGFRVIGVDNFDLFYERSVKEKNMESFISHHNFVFYEADICDGLGQVKEKNIDAVIHLAAKAGVRPSIDDPEGYIRCNITGTQQVHDFMKSQDIHKMVFASSSSVYGNNIKTPFSETDNVDNPISPYAFTKKACELMNYTFHHLYKKDIINLRFFTVYGPRQRPDLAIHKFVHKISKDEPLHLFGDGKTARDYTFIDDTVTGIINALTYCLNNSNLYETLNLGNNRPVTLKELVSIIYKEMDKKENVVYEEMQPGDVEITYADITSANKLINYNPRIDINDGIKRFVHWYYSENKSE